MTPPLYMVFDVESVGLHGEGFSYGYVVVDDHGKELEAGGSGCLPSHAAGAPDDLAWVQEHCPQWTYCGTPDEVRQAFWDVWQRLKSKGAILVADCLWPVEARFLNACIDDAKAERKWEGPYPFIDVASVRLAAGLDPLGTEERLPNELPAHDPLADARQSARLLIEALACVKEPVPA